jgi:hypothetical protein
MALIGAVNEQRTARGWLAADLAEVVCVIRARSAAKAPREDGPLAWTSAASSMNWPAPAGRSLPWPLLQRL